MTPTKETIIEHGSWPADQVSRVPTASLIPYARNARTHSDAQFARNWDLAKWTDERPVDGPAPAPFLSGYLPDATLRKIATKMRANRWS